MLVRSFQNKKVYKCQIFCPLFIITAGKQNAVTQISSVRPPGLRQGDVEVTGPAIEGVHQNGIESPVHSITKTIIGKE